MKSILLAVFLAAPAHAGKFYNLETYPSSGSIHIGYETPGSIRPGLNQDRVFTSSGAAVVQSTSASAGHKPFRVKSNAGAELMSVDTSGNVDATQFRGGGAGLTGIPSTGTFNRAMVAASTGTAAALDAAQRAAVSATTGTAAALDAAQRAAVSATTGTAAAVASADLRVTSPSVSGIQGQFLGLDENGQPEWQAAPSALGLEFLVTNSAADVTGYTYMQLVGDYVNGLRSTNTVTSCTTDVYVSSRITPVGTTLPARIPAGTWHSHLHGKAGANNRVKVKFEVYIRHANGVEDEFFASEPSSFLTTAEEERDLVYMAPSTTTVTGDRFVYKLKVAATGATTSCEFYADGTGNQQTSARLEAPAVASDFSITVPYSGATRNVNLGGYGIGASTGALTGGGDSTPGLAVSSGMTVGKDLAVTGDVSAARFRGDGSLLAGLTLAAAQTRQSFLSGSGTYTTPAGARVLRIKMCAGGGGSGTRSGSTCSQAAGAGGSTVFGSTTAVGGSGGACSETGTTQPAGGAGGTSGAGVVTGVLRFPGQAGGPCNDTLCYYSPAGGSSAFFSGGGASVLLHSATNAGNNGTANTGGGASSGGTVDYGGGSGGGGECVEWLIATPGASYSYSVGAGGVRAESNPYYGGVGGSGIIIVDEMY